MKKKNHQRVPSTRYIKTSFSLPRSKKEQASQLWFALGRQAYQEQVVAQELSAMDQQLSSRGEVDAILQKVLTKLLDPLPSVEELEELEHLADKAFPLQNGKPLVLSKDEESIIIHPILPEWWWDFFIARKIEICNEFYLFFGIASFTSDCIAYHCGLSLQSSSLRLALLGTSLIKWGLNLWDRMLKVPPRWGGCPQDRGSYLFSEEVRV